MDSCLKGYRFYCNGWIYLHTEGTALERGFQHGYLMSAELGRIIDTMKFLTYFNTGKPWEFFVKNAVDLWANWLDDPRYIEYRAEMSAMAQGARAAGFDISYEDILCWNGYEELTDYWWPNVKSATSHYADSTPCRKDHCSAFLAHGKATRDGLIVMGHNSWNEFVPGQFSNVILDIEPREGHRMFMQAAPGYIDSFADFFVTDAKIMGTETTIGGFSMYKPKEVPEFLRIRRAMQYGDTLDDYVEIMKKENNGGYANSWLLADIERDIIMRLELGLQYSNVEMNPKCGYFIGFNAPLDPRIRNLECSNTGFCDIRRHQGARQVRLEQLVQKHYGLLCWGNGTDILADHFDVYTGKQNHPCSRTVDGHYELDDRAYMSDPSRPLPFQPRGAVDGKVMDSEMGAAMSFVAQWGNSSGMPFDANLFLERHPQWNHLKGHLMDRPSQPWTRFTSRDQKGEKV